MRTHRPSRVIQIVPNLESGGAQHMAALLAAGLQETDWPCTVVSLWRAGETQARRIMESAGVPVMSCGKQKGLDARAVKRLYSLLGEIKPEVVHTHLDGLWYGMLPTAAHHVPVRLHTVHNLAHREGSRATRLIHIGAFRMGFRPVAIAERVRESIVEEYGIEPAGMIPNGIDVERFISDKQCGSRWRRKEKLAEERFIICTAGRILPQKDHETLMRAFSHAFSEIDEAMLLIAGRKTPLADSLASLAVALGVDEKVRFLGDRSDIPDMFAACDAFVLSSVYEGHPLALMEAMSAGLPCIATRVGGVPEVIDDGNDGMIVPPSDVAALAERLSTLYADVELQKKLGRMAAKRAQVDFSAGKMADRYAALYQQLSGSKRPG